MFSSSILSKVRIRFQILEQRECCFIGRLIRAIAEVEAAKALMTGVGPTFKRQKRFKQDSKYGGTTSSSRNQQAIVAEIEAEQSLVAANRELVERMEGKIRAAIRRVWSEGDR